MVEEWRVVETIEGDSEAAIRVARWALLDSRPEPAISPGARARLTLEPFERNEQLEGTFVADDLEPGGARLYYRID